MNVNAARRNQVLDRIDDGVAIFPTGGEKLRNADSHFRFRPDSDFYYLTGFGEPDSVLVLAPHHPQHRCILFVRPRDPAREVWTGRRAGVDGAVSLYGADIAYPIEELEQRLPEYLLGAHRLYYRLGFDPNLDQLIINLVHTLRQAKRRPTPSPTQIIDASVILHELRLKKEPDELALIRSAAEITTEAHLAAMAFTRPGCFEHEIEALIEYTFRRRGAVGPAYPSIVGGGTNATVLHYIENNCRLKNGDLLLVDAGAEVGFYSADVTRTYPINGRFTPPQRDVYEVVLAAQHAAIEQVRPGLPFEAAHETAVRWLTEGLLSLGLLRGSLDELLETQAYLLYYMHRTGHWLGLDVHDAGDYIRDGRSRLLEPGMVVTVEPGLYFGIDLPDLPHEFRGIGVRIEDDVLVTSDGYEVLTSRIPKSVDELEALVGRIAE